MMMRYLNPVNRNRHHDVVAHILAPDEEHALCVYRPGRDSWPRVFDGDWEIGDEPFKGYVCGNCRLAELKSHASITPKPAKKTAQEKYLERENIKLRHWNEKARKFMQEMLEKGRD